MALEVAIVVEAGHGVGAAVADPQVAIRRHCNAAVTGATRIGLGPHQVAVGVELGDAIVQMGIEDVAVGIDRQPVGAAADGVVGLDAGRRVVAGKAAGGPARGPQHAVAVDQAAVAAIAAKVDDGALRDAGRAIVELVFLVAVAADPDIIVLVDRDRACVGAGGAHVQQVGGIGGGGGAGGVGAADAHRVRSARIAPAEHVEVAAVPDPARGRTSRVGGELGHRTEASRGLIAVGDPHVPVLVHRGARRVGRLALWSGAVFAIHRTGARSRFGKRDTAVGVHVVGIDADCRTAPGKCDPDMVEGGQHDIVEANVTVSGCGWRQAVGVGECSGRPIRVGRKGERSRPGARGAHESGGG